MINFLFVAVYLSFFLFFLFIFLMFSSMYFFCFFQSIHFFSFGRIHIGKFILCKVIDSLVYFVHTNTHAYIHVWNDYCLVSKYTQWLLSDHFIVYRYVTRIRPLRLEQTKIDISVLTYSKQSEDFHLSFNSEIKYW